MSTVISVLAADKRLMVQWDFSVTSQLQLRRTADDAVCGSCIDDEGARWPHQSFYTAHLPHTCGQCRAPWGSVPTLGPKNTEWGCVGAAGTTFAVVSDQATMASQLYAAGSGAADDGSGGGGALPAEPVRRRLLLARSDAALSAVAESPSKASTPAEKPAGESAAAEGKRKVRWPLAKLH